MTASSSDHNVEIVPLPRNPANALRFLKVSYNIYNGDPNWVAPLLGDLKLVFDDKKPALQRGGDGAVDCPPRRTGHRAASREF